MTGGKITNNIVSSTSLSMSGGGIYLANTNDIIEISGSAQILGNTAYSSYNDDKSSDLYVEPSNYSKQIRLVDDFTGVVYVYHDADQAKPGCYVGDAQAQYDGVNNIHCDGNFDLIADYMDNGDHYDIIWKSLFILISLDKQTGTGAYNIVVGNEIYTGNDVRITGKNGSTIYYMFNGDFWIYMNNNEDRLVRKIVLMWLLC